PGSRLYFLIKLKEDLRILKSLGMDKLKLKLDFLGKRLVEAIRLKEKGETPEASINAYRKLLVEVFYTDNLRDQLDFIGGRGFVNDLFAKHLVILNSLEGVKGAKDELLTALRQSEVIPMYDVAVDKNTSDLEYTTYHFQVPRNDEYELLMADKGVRNVYADKLEIFEFQIDGEKKQLKGEIINGFISYGKVKLDAGKKEFTLVATPSANLFDYPADSGIEISSIDKNNSFFETRIEPLTYNTWYTVKFEAWIKSGDKFRLQFISDGNVEYEKFFTKDDQNGWNKYRESILFNKPAATYAAVKFLVEPSPKKTQAIIRNLKIERLLNNLIFLRSENKPMPSETPNEKIEFVRYSPVFYSGKIGLERDGFVIFSEAFHKDWQLKLHSNGKTLIPKERFLANMYANAWFVPAGNYTFELEFTPQKTLYWGMLISGITACAVVIFYLGKIKKWLKK
ncbi:MAG: hypothetical protein Q8Q91_03520, partial [Candidatus Daviesbacteria bacterium]|nr:hypothetical protein [Candidatus Daviesbacteria bacterium]